MCCLLAILLIGLVLGSEEGDIPRLINRWIITYVVCYHMCFWKPSIYTCPCWLLFDKQDTYTKMTLLDVGNYLVSQLTAA